MYYLDGGILNILSNLYLDLVDSIPNHIYSNKRITEVTVKELFDFLGTTENSFLDMISGIIATTDPLCLSSLHHGSKFFTDITLEEIIKVKNQIPFMTCDSLVKTYTSDFNRIYRKLPFDIISLYDKKINKSLGVISLFNGKNSNKETKYYLNNRDSIMYLSNLNILDEDISASIKSKIFTNEELSKLYSITIRLILPKFVADKIKCKHKMQFLYKSDDNRIQFSDIKDINPLHIRFNENVRLLTDEGTRYLDMLSNNTLYKVYLNVTIKELSDIINNLSYIEELYRNQVIGATYYNLINYSNINSLFTIDEQVKLDIEKRIYDRVGN